MKTVPLKDCLIGYEIFKGIKFICPIPEIIMQHH